jgi:hypothetical protein
MHLDSTETSPTMSRHRESLIAASLLLVLAGVAAAADPRSDKQPATYTIPLPPKPDFSPLAWLVGDWAGHTTGKDSQGDVHLTLSYALDQRFIIFREEVSLPAGRSSPALHESSMGLIAAELSRPGYRLQLYSRTGFITLYHVTATPDQARFDPEGGVNPPPGWLFRRTITRVGPDVCNDQVQVAPPDKAFFEYYSATLTLAPQTKTPAAKPATSPPSAAP